MKIRDILKKVQILNERKLVLYGQTMNQKNYDYERRKMTHRGLSDIYYSRKMEYSGLQHVYLPMEYVKLMQVQSHLRQASYILELLHSYSACECECESNDFSSNFHKKICTISLIKYQGGLFKILHKQVLKAFQGYNPPPNALHCQSFFKIN